MGRSTSVIPPVPAAGSVTTMAFMICLLGHVVLVEMQPSRSGPEALEVRMIDRHRSPQQISLTQRDAELAQHAMLGRRFDSLGDELGLGAGGESKQARDECLAGCVGVDVHRPG